LPATEYPEKNLEAFELLMAINDGSRFEEGMGFAGIGHNVELCVYDFDRWYVYNGHLRVLR
jgi:hypothetical protein